MRVGIYGGSFNPPHRGHTDTSHDACEQLRLDKLIVVPTGEPPHKRLAENSPSAQHRLQMTRLAFSQLKNAEVSDIEVRRSGGSYTIDTVRELKKKYPNDELFLIMGTDMFLTLDSWRDAQELAALVTPAAMHRGGFDAEKARLQAEKLRLAGFKSELIENKTIEISSTELRLNFSQRLKTWHIDDGVYSYIIENGLYEAQANFDWLRCRAYEMLEKKRIPHVAGCEETAVRLAERWGADPEKAREAAILHDITKKLDASEQLELCRELGVETDELERASWKMLHAKSAAAYAEKYFCVSGDVKNAIRWHTTGCAGMALLEKIIYVADYMEPNRKFEGVAKMRRLAFSDLDAALVLGMRMSIDDLLSRGIAPHKTTLAAVEFLSER